MTPPYPPENAILPGYPFIRFPAKRRCVHCNRELALMQARVIWVRDEVNRREIERLECFDKTECKAP